MKVEIGQMWAPQQGTSPCRDILQVFQTQAGKTSVTYRTEDGSAYVATLESWQQWVTATRAERVA